MAPVRAMLPGATAMAMALALALAMATAVGTGCKRAAPDVAPAPQVPAELEVLKDGRYLFTYVEPSGTFATTDKPEIIPAGSQQVVRVVDPTKTKTREGVTVYVVDVRQLQSAGKAAARPLSREAFETAALAQLPPGASSPLGGGGPAAPGAGVAQAHPPAVADAGVVTSPPGAPVVTIYGTSWCGACRTARQYFADRKIPFADRDVERDPAAARELAGKAAKSGIPTDRVPILEVRGRLLLGFDRARVEALLGDPT
jgi:glutaredoxin